MTFVKVLERAALAPGAAATVTVGREPVVLVDCGGDVVAVDGACLRCGAPLFGGGAAPAGGIVACPGCDWRYDLRTGQVVGLPGLGMTRHAVRVTPAAIFVARSARGRCPGD